MTIEMIVSKERVMKKILSSLPAKLLLGIVVGIILGLIVPESVMTVLVPIKNILNQVISFVVPLIVIGFIAPSITKLGIPSFSKATLVVSLPYASILKKLPHLPIA